jgi:hypothetical protein
MPAAVMPRQPFVRDVSAEALVEDALQVFQVRGVVVAIAAPVEERGRRQLFRIADDNHLLAARDRADRIPDRYLRGLIKNHNIERLGVGR